MTKTQLIQAVAARTGVTRATAECVVSVFFDAMTQALQEGRRIEIRGLGSFKVRSYQGYQGHNPRTQESIEVLPKHLPVFKAGKEIRERLNKQGKEPPSPRKENTSL